MKVILSPFKDPAEGLDWHEQSPVLLAQIRTYLDEFTSLSTTIQETNHGRAADLATVTVVVTAFFAIPPTYRRIKDACKGWKEIIDDLSQFFEIFNQKYPIAGYDDEALFLTACLALKKKYSVQIGELIVLHDPVDLPVDSQGVDRDLNKHILYSFSSTEAIYQVSLNAKGDTQIIHAFTLPRKLPNLAAF